MIALYFVLSEGMDLPAIDIYARTPQPQSSECKHPYVKHPSCTTVCILRSTGEAKYGAKIIGVTGEAL